VDLVVLIFANEASDPLTSLVKTIDEKVNEAAGKYQGGQQQLGSYVIFNDATGLADQLRDVAKKEAIQRVSVCIGAVPPRYEVNKEADVTVVIYNPARRGQQTVQANFALRKGELTESKRDAIVDALVKVLPK
jgi:hypothetical protein